MGHAHCAPGSTGSRIRRVAHVQHPSGIRGLPCSERVAQYKTSRKSPDARLRLVDGNAHGTDMFGADPQVWKDVKAFMARHK